MLDAQSKRESRTSASVRQTPAQALPQRGFGMIEPLVSISILACLSLGLALFMGRSSRALAVARAEAEAACRSPSCGAAGSLVRCGCGKAAWSYVP